MSEWWENGDYDGTECNHCGRERVMKMEDPAGAMHRVCEKCGWDQDADDYAVSLVGIETRDEAWKRTSNMAGVDENGNLLPPAPGTKISIVPNPWWKTRDYTKEIERDGSMTTVRTVNQKVK